MERIIASLSVPRSPFHAYGTWHIGTWAPVTLTFLFRSIAVQFFLTLQWFRHWVAFLTYIRTACLLLWEMPSHLKAILGETKGETMWSHHTSRRWGNERVEHLVDEAINSWTVLFSRDSWNWSRWRSRWLALASAAELEPKQDIRVKSPHSARSPSCLPAQLLGHRSTTAALGIRVNKGKLRQSRNNPCRTGSAD